MRFEVFDYAQLATGAFAPGHAVTIYESDGVTKATLYVSETGGTTSNPIVSDSTGLVHCWVTSTKLYKSVDGGPLTPLKITAPVGGMYLSATDFGVVGDGVHDDTSALQAAIDKAAGTPTYYSNGPGNVVLLPPNATMILTSPLLLKSRVHIVGAGWSTVLKQTGTGPVISFWTGDTTQIHDTLISDLVIYGNWDDTATGDGISAIEGPPYGIFNCKFNNLLIKNCGRDGLHFEYTQQPAWWAQYMTFDNVYCGDTYQTGRGFRRYGGYFVGGFSTNRFRGGWFQYAQAGGIYLSGSSNGGVYNEPESNLFQNVLFQLNQNGDTVVHGAQVLGAKSTHFDTCYFEANGLPDTSHASSHIFLGKDPAWVLSRGTMLTNNRFSAFWNAITLDYCTGTTIQGNLIHWNGTSPASAGTFINITPNVEPYSTESGLNYPNDPSHSTEITYVGGSGNVHDLLGYHEFYVAGSNAPTRWDRRIKVAAHLIDYGTAAPTTGTYNPGDRVYNSSPAVGQPLGWVCTAYGTPGTWVAMMNLDTHPIVFAAAAPTTGTWIQGSQILNTGAAPGGYVGWVCTTAGKAHPACTGDTTASSTSITNVNPTTAFANGDAIKGAGIPAGTTVVSGGGTATLVISQAATATATGVSLYDAVFKTFGAISP